MIVDETDFGGEMLSNMFERKRVHDPITLIILAKYRC